MITKEKKATIIEEGINELEGAKLLIFADFQGTKVEELRELRKELKAANARFKIIKKRLLRLVFRRKGIDFDPLKFRGSLGVILSESDISEIVQPVYKFSKDYPNFKLLGGLNAETKDEIPLETLKMIGSLPSREILLAQLMGALTAPLRGLMYILQERSKRS